MFRFITLASIIGLIFLEVTMFGLIGSVLGVLPTILGVFITAAIGLRLFRISGHNALRRMAESIQQDRTPVFEVADGMAITLAAILLLIPGYITDALGLLLFIPGLRAAIIMSLTMAFASFRPVFVRSSSMFYSSSRDTTAEQRPRKNSQTEQAQTKQASEAIIDGDYKRRDES